MATTGMFLYPWDLGGTPEQFEREYPATGCNALAPALSYHHGHVLAARSGKSYTLSEAALSFAPKPALYGEIKPAVHQATAARYAAEGLREWCEKTDRRFDGWAVLLHNSTIGARWPHTTVENAFGDRLENTLCPANPAVREYTAALLEDICVRFAPHSLIVEQGGPGVALHGAHHEISNTHISPAARWLLSLCFCEHCLAKAGGEDGAALREEVKRLVLYMLNAEPLFEADESALTLLLLQEYPALYAYAGSRQRVVGEYTGLIAETLSRHGVGFTLIPSALPFDCNHGFMEGMGLHTGAAPADTLLPLLYAPGESYPAVKNILGLCGWQKPVAMAATLHPARFAAKGEFLSFVAGAAGAGCETAYFYNYSIASRERLGWVNEARGLLAGAGKEA